MDNCVFQVICNLFVSLLLLLLSVNGTTNGSEQDCLPQVKVPRKTVFKSRAMTELKINCTVTLRGCHRRARVAWCKITGNDCNALNHSDYIKTEWKNTAKEEGIYFLTFLNISMEDAGAYRCRENNLSVSHTITVDVTSDNSKNTFLPTPRNPSNGMAITTHDKLHNDDQQWLWLYLHICGGIAGLVFIIMTITLLYVIRHQVRKSTIKDMANKNQYITTQNNDLLLPPHLYLNSDLLTTVIYRV